MTAQVPRRLWPGARRWILAVLVGLVGLLVIVPVAAAATGAIEGVVTESKGKGIKDVGVFVDQVVNTGEESHQGFAATDANGHYEVEGLPKGNYKVEFAPSSGDNYVTQYWHNKLTSGEAESVVVKEGETHVGINATLAEGGEITGTVTDAYTHKGVNEIVVLAEGPEGTEQPTKLAETNENGEYTLVGLATGNYKVGFFDGLEVLPANQSYFPQYFNNVTEYKDASLVNVTQGSITPAINAALLPRAPVNKAAPKISGTPAVGQSLTCSEGSWAGESAITLSYQWLRNGSPISGANGSAYGVQSADQGDTLVCEVTASNAHGRTGAKSNSLQVPAAPVVTPAVTVPSKLPPPTPTVTLLSSKIVVSSNSARIPIACASATCTGTIELTEQIVISQRQGSRTVLRAKTLVLGKGSYTLTAGHSATVIVHLTKIGRQALARARRHRLSVTALASVAGGTTVQKTVVLSQPKPKAKHKP